MFGDTHGYNHKKVMFAYALIVTYFPTSCHNIHHSIPKVYSVVYLLYAGPAFLQSKQLAANPASWG